MCVREPQCLEVQPEPADLLQQHPEIAAGVDDGGIPGGIAPDDGGVLLELGDGNGEVLEHGVSDFC